MPDDKEPKDAPVTIQIIVKDPTAIEIPTHTPLELWNSLPSELRSKMADAIKQADGGHEVVDFIKIIREKLSEQETFSDMTKEEAHAFLDRVRNDAEAVHRVNSEKIDKILWRATFELNQQNMLKLSDQRDKDNKENDARRAADLALTHRNTIATERSARYAIASTIVATLALVISAIALIFGK